MGSILGLVALRLVSESVDEPPVPIFNDSVNGSGSIIPTALTVIISCAALTPPFMAEKPTYPPIGREIFFLIEKQVLQSVNDLS